MDIIECLGLIATIATLVSIPSLVSYYTDKFPWIREKIYIILNKSYKVQIKGTKQYDIFEWDVKQFKNNIFEYYKPIRISATGKNYIILLIENMQSPYKIQKLPILNDFGEIIGAEILITLEGSVNFSYRNTLENNKILDVMDNLFKIIEGMETLNCIFSRFSLEADTKNEFKNKPFISNYSSVDCEDTKIEIDKEINFLRINSSSINNINKCLKRNILKII